MQQGDLDIFTLFKSFTVLLFQASGLSHVRRLCLLKTENPKYSVRDFLISLKIFGIHVSIDDICKLCTGDQAKPLKYSCASNVLFLYENQVPRIKKGLFQTHVTIIY